MIIQSHLNGWLLTTEAVLFCNASSTAPLKGLRTGEFKSKHDQVVYHMPVDPKMGDKRIRILDDMIQHSGPPQAELNVVLTERTFFWTCLSLMACTLVIYTRSSRREASKHRNLSVKYSK
jgi:hypothetical protein